MVETKILSILLAAILFNYYSVTARQTDGNEESVSNESIPQEKIIVSTNVKPIIDSKLEISASNETYLPQLLVYPASDEKDNSIIYPQIKEGYCEAIPPTEKQFSKEFFFRTGDVDDYNFFADLNWGRMYFDFMTVSGLQMHTYIALTETTSLNEQSYVIEIGINNNQETRLLKNGTEVAKVISPNILQDSRKVKLWLDWDCGKISLGYGESPAFLQWVDMQPFNIQYVLIDKVGALWYFSDYKRVKSADEGYYYATNQIIDIEFKGAMNSYVGFFGKNVPQPPVHTVLIGGGKGTYSFLFSKQGNEFLKAVSETLNITAANEFRSFRVERKDGFILVFDFKSRHPFVPILSYEEHIHEPLDGIGFKTGGGALGMWKIKRACSIKYV